MTRPISVSSSVEATVNQSVCPQAFQNCGSPQSCT